MGLRRGNTYNLEIRILIDGLALTAGDVNVVEFMFDDLRKVYSETSLDGVTFDTDHFIIPFTQEETFSLNKKSIQYQARIKFTNGDVKGTPVKTANIYESLSQEVI